MKLEFRQVHLSITPYNAVDLDPFTVLTGVNGSGKSQLLEAIVNKKSVITGCDNLNIVHFNYETFKLENENTFNAQQISTEKEAAWTYFNTNIKGNISTYKNQLGADQNLIINECKNNKKSLWKVASSTMQQYKIKVKNLFSNQTHKNNNSAHGIYSMIKKQDKFIDDIPHEEFIEIYKPYAYKNNFLPNQLGKVIWDYFVKYNKNQFHIFQNKEYGKSFPTLTESEFIEIHGDKPWDVINNILSKFDSLSYRINSPEGSDYFGSFNLKLKHINKSNVEIPFSNLSSGEKVLMALVASIYKSSSDGYFPDILLLDEIDASLHPSMIKNMLSVINDVFLKNNIKVILVTHSPTTIALSPSNSIFVMNKDGQNRIERKSKQDALSILTEGFATIDEGIKLFDQASKNSISVITEGKNAQLIEKAIKLFEINNIEVVKDLENITGKNQMKTLFDFFSRTKHDTKVVFVWDCDVNYKLNPVNNTYPYVLEKNIDNNISEKGIENMFSESLFSGFTNTINKSNGDVIISFDGNRKKDFTNFIISRDNPNDFIKFKSLFSYISSL